MTTEFVALILSTMGFLCFVGLALVRYRHRNGRYNARLLLLDLLLVVAAFEVIADQLHHLTDPGPWAVFWQAAATACQGALIAGGVALVASYRRGR